MRIVIILIGVFLASFVRSDIALQSRPTENEISDEYLGKDAALRGYGSVIEDTYETFEQTDEITREQAKQLESEAKENVRKEILPNYRTRSIKKIE